MPESAYPRLRIAAALVMGLALCAVAGLGGAVAAVAGWLAQPALALAVRGWREGALPAREALLRDARALFVLWGGTIATVAWWMETFPAFEGPAPAAPPATRPPAQK